MKRVISTTQAIDNRIEQLAHKVADDFKQTMKEEGFESFEDMKQCYMWESSDIKEEILYMINHEYGKELELMCDDYGNIFSTHSFDDLEYSYRKFRLLINKYLRYEEEED